MLSPQFRAIDKGLNPQRYLPCRNATRQDPTSQREKASLLTKKIEAGVRILADELLFSIWVIDGDVDEGLEENIREALERLRPYQEQLYNTLHCPDHPSWTSLKSRYLANCFEISQGQSGIFLEASLLNHSCCPNALYSWNKDLGRIVVHAMVDISAGEEITISYIQPFLPRVYRQAILREYDGFECQCPACDRGSFIGNINDKNRTRMDLLWLTVNESKSGPSNKDAQILTMILEFNQLRKVRGAGRHISLHHVSSCQGLLCWAGRKGIGAEICRKESAGSWGGWLDDEGEYLKSMFGVDGVKKSQRFFILSYIKVK